MIWDSSHKKILITAIAVLSYTILFGQIFSDISTDIGFNHAMNARGLMGGGVAFFDMDQDGDDDFYITGGMDKDQIYLNDGNGSFSLILDDIGLNITSQFNTTGVATGDIDNDGDRDIFVTTWERYESGNDIIARNLVFVNNGDGSFIEAGLDIGITHQAFSIGASFLDFNKDGLLDIYIVNHVDQPAFLYDYYGVIVGFDHTCFPNYLYKNLDGTNFEEVSMLFGVNSSGCGLAVVPSDYDQDGDLDIFIANDFGPFLTPNELFSNNYPAEDFTEVGNTTGANIPMYGMGIAVSDYDQDLDLDYYITNLGSNVLLNNDSNQFSDVAANAGVESTFANNSDFSTGWGTAFFDVNNDTWEDLFVSNGRIPSLPSLPTAPQDPNKLFLNNGDGSFADVSVAAQVNSDNYNRGMAYSDFDQDGDLDMIVVALNELGGRSRIFRNDTQNDNHFIQFKLIGTESNKDAFGSKIWIYINGQGYIKELYGGGASHVSQHSSIIHFGLNDAIKIDSLKIQWTNGLIENFGSFEGDQRYEITEGVTSGLSNNNISDLTNFQIFPNPVSDKLFISNKSFLIEPVGYKIYSISGQLIYQQNNNSKIENEILLPIGFLPGMYLLEIETDIGVQRIKFIKS